MDSFSFAILPERRILKESIRGFWNVEIASAYDHAFRIAVEPLLGAPWAICIDLREWNPSNPKVMRILSRLIEWARKQDLRFSANIVTTAVPRLQMNTMLKVGLRKSYYEFFESEKAALDWLASKGF